MFWPIVFCAATAALVAALITKKLIGSAYALATAAFVFHGVARMFDGHWSVASLSLGMAAACLILGSTYAKG